MATRVANAMEVKQDLYDRNQPSTNEIDMLFGYDVQGDIFPEIWQHSPSSGAADDFPNGIVKPTAETGNARWLRKFQFKQPDFDQSDSAKIDFIKNKPSLATVATSGSYNDLSNKPTITVPPVHSDLSGTPVSVTKWATGTVTPSTGDGYSIDISGVGFANIIGYSIEAIKNTATPTSAPKVSVKTVSNSAIVVNIIEGNASTVNLLGSLVLLGASEQFAVTTGLTLKVSVWGN